MDHVFGPKGRKIENYSVSSEGSGSTRTVMLSANVRFAETAGTIYLGTNPSPLVSVGSEIGRIPLNPQRPSRARSMEKQRRLKYVVPFVDLNLMIFLSCGP